MLDSIFGPYKKYATLVLRLVVAYVFIVHGWGKLTGIAGTAGFFGKLGIPLATFFAWIVAIVEFGGGILVLVGVLTRISSLLLAVTMLVAILLHEGGFELELTLLAMSVGLMLLGNGPLSIGGSGETHE